MSTSTKTVEYVLHAVVHNSAKGSDHVVSDTFAIPTLHAVEAPVAFRTIVNGAFPVTVDTRVVDEALLRPIYPRIVVDEFASTDVAHLFGTAYDTSDFWAAAGIDTISRDGLMVIDGVLHHRVSRPGLLLSVNLDRNEVTLVAMTNGEESVRGFLFSVDEYDVARDAACRVAALLHTSPAINTLVEISVVDPESVQIVSETKRFEQFVTALHAADEARVIASSIQSVTAMPGTVVPQTDAMRSVIETYSPRTVSA